MASAAPTTAPGTPTRTRGRRRPGWVLRLIGKTLLTLALFLAAYIAWLLWGTGLYHSSQQSDLRQELEAEIALAGPEEHRGVDPRPAIPGQAYAILEIPRLDLDEVVVEGTETEALQKGPGHYEDTGDPWDDAGRVGIAGHRTTYGAPFWDLDKLRAGDDITLETVAGRFEYEVYRTDLVEPDAKGILTGGADHATLVLTTCHPRFSAAQRLIVYAERLD